MKKISTLFSLVLLLTGCGQEPAKTTESADQPGAQPEISVYAAAVANPSRLEGDYARDAGRKPDQVLEFLGVKPGMTILDMFAGGGYYTEIIAGVVGGDGKVVSHSNEAYLNFVGEEFAQRHAEGRLPNVEVMMAENNELSLDAGVFDAIVLVLAYHDIYWESVENGWPAIDREKLLAEFHRGLKADGFIGIVDHSAAAGSPSETGSTVHRIDPAIVIADMQAAGFVVDGSSELLRNPEDDYSKGVFDPETRGKTDRFILRFRKAD